MATLQEFKTLRGIKDTIDYLIVGCGLAGIYFSENVLHHNKTVLVLDNNSQNSSKVAGGLYNPVILKRFTEVWEAQSQLTIMNEFHSRLKQKIGVDFDFKKPIFRKFFSVEEQNNWFVASDKKTLAPFLSNPLTFKDYKGISAPFGYGEVRQTGYIDTTLLMNAYREYLTKQHAFRLESFDYNALILKEKNIEYKNIQAKHIVFAEGFGMHANPYFNKLPLDGTKGELLIIKAPHLELDVIINTSIFILPLGNNLFKIGATYNWQDKTDCPTEEGKKELIEKIKEIIDCDFEIVSHFAGVRPTVSDRKPLVGTHPIYQNMHILNGLGTRGVMLGPAMAKALYENIEHQIPLDPVIDIRRFFNCTKVGKLSAISK